MDNITTNERLERLEERVTDIEKNNLMAEVLEIKKTVLLMARKVDIMFGPGPETRTAVERIASDEEGSDGDVEQKDRRDALDDAFSALNAFGRTNSFDTSFVNEFSNISKRSWSNVSLESNPAPEIIYAPQKTNNPVLEELRFILGSNVEKGTSKTKTRKREQTPPRRRVRNKIPPNNNINVGIPSLKTGGKGVPPHVQKQNNVVKKKTKTFFSTPITYPTIPSFNLGSKGKMGIVPRKIRESQLQDIKKAKRKSKTSNVRAKKKRKIEQVVDETEYVPEKIVYKRDKKGKIEYRVFWHGYDPKDKNGYSWEGIDADIFKQNPDWISKFEASLLKK